MDFGFLKKNNFRILFHATSTVSKLNFRKFFFIKTRWMYLKIKINQLKAEMTKLSLLDYYYKKKKTKKNRDNIPKFQCLAAMAIWSVTGLHAAPNRINFFGRK